MKSKTTFTPLEIKISNRGSRKFLTGSTKKDLVVVLGCVVFLLANLGTVGSGGRERAKRAVCLDNLRQLTLAWVMYADDNEGKIVNGLKAKRRPGRECMAFGGPFVGGWEWAWVCDDASWRDEEERIQAIKDGALFPYTKDVKLYKCPTALPQEVRTYAIVDSMNAGYSGADGFYELVIKNRMQIKKPGKRLVFVDEGKITTSGWTVSYAQEKWYDRPPIRHANGATFSFADGHSEHWEWQDQRTIDYANRVPGVGRAQPGNPDLHRCQIGVWGHLGYEPSPQP